MVLRVKDIMSPNPITVERDHTLFHVKELMILYQPDCFVVLDAGKKLVGVITQNDLAAEFDPDVRVEKVMRRDPPKINANESIQEAARILSSSEAEALPVVDNQGNLVGVVTYKDIVKDMVVDHTGSKLSPESAVIYLAMTKDPEQEEYWLQKVINAGYRAAITQVGATAEKLPIKLREATIVAAIARSVIREDPREKFAVSNAVRDIFSQLSIINPGLGGGFKVAIVRGEGRVAVAAFGRCGHALANGTEQIVMGSNII